jgi:chromate transporter
MSVAALALLALLIAVTSVFSFGGITVVLAQLSEIFVDVGGVMSADDFWETYALAAAMPGPNGPIFMASLGWQTAGLIGVVVCVVAWAVPTLAAMYTLGALGDHADESAWIGRLLGVFTMLAVGLIFAGVVAMVRVFDFSAYAGYLQVLLAAAGVVALHRSWLSPLQVLLGCMAIGLVAL